MILAGPFLTLLLAAMPAQGSGSTAAEAGSTHDLAFLAENRPIFVRFQVMGKDRPFEASWIDSIRSFHKTLDRDGDGKLTVKEADPSFLNALARLAIGGSEPVAVGELDVNPKDEVVSIEELAETLRPILSPFRLQAGRQAAGRTDALFDRLDRNKDAALTKPELATIAGTLRPLDLDDNDMIGAEELEPFNNPAVMAQAQVSSERKARLATLPPVIELMAGESSLRLARLFLKKYDKGKDGLPGPLDNKLSLEEFAIAPANFAAADGNSDEKLDTDELRKFLAQPAFDLSVRITFPPEPSSVAVIKVEGEETLPNETKVRRFANGDIELAIGQARLDIRADNGEKLADTVRRLLEQRFKGFDVNKDGYLEGKEREAANAAGSPIAGLAEVIDRDADGKLYLKELLDFGDLQTEGARCRLVAVAADQGRAIFGILDLDKDRRLSARELQRTVDRVTSWDGDGDGKVSADDIPYHFQVNIARAGLPGLNGENAANLSSQSSAGSSAAPEWFRRMDRNHDGDISRREFLGPRDQFDRLDRDKDGLINPDEALAAASK